jgi:hypothetical protein
MHEAPHTSAAGGAHASVAEVAFASSAQRPSSVTFQELASG